MRQFKLICAECGKAFIKDADYDTPGIQGCLVTSNGSYVRFIDSTEPQYCPDCTAMRLTKILYELYKQTWCAERGYDISDVSEETGINGECYACFDEWYNNEFHELLKGEN